MILPLAHPGHLEEQMAKRIGTVDTPYGAGDLVRRQYGNGALALVIEPQIAIVSVNLDHGQHCTQSGDLPADHFYVDANNLSRELLDSLLASGHVEATNLPEGISGYCTYPVWRLVARESATA
jgi:hypothetical protein